MVFVQTHGLCHQLLLIIHLIFPHYPLKMKIGVEMVVDKEEMVNMITGNGLKSSQF